MTRKKSRKRNAAKAVMDKVARREALKSKPLQATVRDVRQLVDSEPRIKEEQLNRRAGY